MTVFSKLSHLGQKVIHYAVTCATEFYSIFIYNLSTIRSGLKEPFRWHGLNPTQLDKNEARKPAILFLHGQGHNQSGVIPLAKKLQKANISPVFTLNLTYNEKKPELHENQLIQRISEIKELYKKNGQKNLQLILVGHSRGGIEALNYICCKGPQKNVTVKCLITIAVRMEEVPTKWRNCSTQVIELIRSFSKEKHKYRDLLYHVASDKDWRVPLDAALYNKDKGHYHIVKNRSHMGILYAKETHDKVIEYIRKNYD